MKSKIKNRLVFPAICAGAVNGLLGAGGGMVLVPLLGTVKDLKDEEVFPTSVSLILPICVVSLLCSPNVPLTWATITPYILGSAAGGILCGFLGKRIPVKWLHKGLGIIMIWGGIRYLC